MIRKESKATAERPVKLKDAKVGDRVDVTSEGGEFAMQVYRPHVLRAARGRPSSGKVVVSIRLDPAVIAKFKATGRGWQGRMNEALKAAKF